MSELDASSVNSSIKDLCKEGKLTDLRERARQEGLDLSSDDLDEEAQIRYYCYGLTQDRRYRCRNRESFLGDDFFTYEDDNDLFVDETNHCFTREELKAMANNNRFHLDTLRHPYLGQPLRDLRLNYLDYESSRGNLIETTYGELLRSLVQPKPLPRTGPSVPELPSHSRIRELERLLLEEINYAITDEMSHYYLELRDLTQYSDPRGTQIVGPITPERYQQLRQKGLEVLLEVTRNTVSIGLHLFTPYSLQNFGGIERHTYLKADGFQRQYQKLLIQLVHYFHHFNLLYDQPGSNKFILDHIKLAVIRQLKSGRPYPRPVLLALGPEFYFPYSRREEEEAEA